MGWVGPMTHRQYAAWGAWEADQWNRPSRTDHELAAIRLEILRMFAKDPSLITADTPGVKLEFVEVAAKDPASGKPPGETAEEFTARHKAAWGAFLKGSKGRRPS
jgi:hypothetical protein